jgi:hypothetical protein
VLWLCHPCEVRTVHLGMYAVCLPFAVTTTLQRIRTMIVATVFGVTFVSVSLAASGPAQYLKGSDRWFASDEAQRIKWHSPGP